MIAHEDSDGRNERCDSVLQAAPVPGCVELSAQSLRSAARGPAGDAQWKGDVKSDKDGDYEICRLAPGLSHKVNNNPKGYQTRTRTPSQCSNSTDNTLV